MRIAPKKLVIGLAVALILYSLLGFFILPAIALRVINSQLEQKVTVPARLESIKFNPFSLEATLGELHIGEPDRPQLAFARLYANLQIDSLWSGALHLSALDLEQADVRVAIAEDGTVDLTELFVLEPQADTEEPASDPFPVRIDRLALIAGSVQFTDHSLSTPFSFAYDAIDLEMYNLSTLPGDRSAATLTTDGTQGALLSWEGEISLVPFASSGELQLASANLATFQPYIQDLLPLTIDQGTLDVSTDYHVSLDEGLRARLENLQLALSELAISEQDASRLLRLESLTLAGSSLDLMEQRIQLGTLRSKGLETRAELQADGTLNWQALLAGGDSREPPEEPADSATTPEQPLEPTDTGVSEPAKLWQIKLSDAQLRGYHVHLKDHQPEQTVSVDLGPLDLDINNFDSLASEPFSLRLGTGINDGGRLDAEGQVTLNPMSAQLRVSTQNIDLLPAQSYLAPLLRIELRSGLLSSDTQVELASVDPLQLTVSGDGQVEKLHIVDAAQQRDLVKWQQLELADIRYQDDHLSIGQVSLTQPYLRFIINRDMSTNLSDLIIAAEPTNTDDQDQPFGIRIGGINIDDGSANFADFSLRPNFSTAIEQLTGSIGTLDNQLNKAAAIDLDGKVDRYAPVTIKGSLTPFDPLNSLDIATSFKDVELTTLTPYSGKFAGYPIRKGRLNLDLHYQIDQGQLKAENRVVLEDLQLGERVDSADAVDLPVRLAIALLKDAKGNIDIELPLRGDLNDPEFSVMPIVWQTLRNLVLRATQAPFKFIAGLAGGGGDTDLSQIGFAAGSAELDEEAINALGALAAALKERPNLILEVEGQSAVENDAPLLAMARLEREYQQVAYDELKRRNKTLPEDPAELVIEEDDKAKLLREIYTERLQLSVPESWKELSQDERDQQMQQALIANWSDKPLPLRRLAQQRAARVKAWLVDQGGLEAERVHLLDVNSNTAPINGKVPTALQLGVQ